MSNVARALVSPPFGVGWARAVACVQLRRREVFVIARRPRLRPVDSGLRDEVWRGPGLAPEPSAYTVRALIQKPLRSGQAP